MQCKSDHQENQCLMMVILKTTVQRNNLFCSKDDTIEPMECYYQEFS